MQEKNELSIIIPSYNEQEHISRTFHTIKEILDNEYNLSAYFNWFIESMKIIYAWFVDLIGNGI